MKTFLLMFVFGAYSSHTFSQNVGVGTLTPASKFSVGANSQFQIDNIGNIQKINDIPYSFPFIQGTSGQVLINDGTGQLNWNNVQNIITLTPLNYLSTSVASNNYIKIDGEISLTQDYSELEKTNLQIAGGKINGDGSSVLKIGRFVTCIGTTFNNINIEGENISFINCVFTGTSQAIGDQAKYLHCTFNSLTVSDQRMIGNIENSTILNCGMPRLSGIYNSNISSSTIGGNNFDGINGCIIENSTINNCFQFTNNRCEDSKIMLSPTPSDVNISHNTFDGIFSGHTEVIEINPSNSGAKFINIKDNIFRLSSSSARIIAITGDDGSYPRSVLNIQGNIFYNGVDILYYSSNLKTIYSQNVASYVAHPSQNGNLIVGTNY